jgi:hypothetical protein
MRRATYQAEAWLCEKTRISPLIVIIGGVSLIDLGVTMLALISQ